MKESYPENSQKKSKKNLKNLKSGDRKISNPGIQNLIKIHEKYKHRIVHIVYILRFVLAFM